MNKSHRNSDKRRSSSAAAPHSPRIVIDESTGYFYCGLWAALWLKIAASPADHNRCLPVSSVKRRRRLNTCLACSSLAPLGRPRAVVVIGDRLARSDPHAASLTFLRVQQSWFGVVLNTTFRPVSRSLSLCPPCSQTTGRPLMTRIGGE